MKYLIFLLIFAVACDDATTVAPTPDATVDSATLPPPDAAPPAPDAEVIPDAAVEIDAAPPPAPAWVEVVIEPRQALYTRADVPRVTAQAFDRIGRPIEAELAWHLSPPGIGEVAEGALTFLGEGQGIVQACLGEVCGQTAFFVDDAPPTLVLASPEQHALLSGFGGRTIAVRGTATDSRGPVAVRVNGLRADVGPDGSFLLDLPADFGLNRVVVEADDGVRQPAVREVRELMWAPRFLPVEADGVQVPGALTLRMDQALLDRDLVVDVPPGAGSIVVDEVAGFLGLLLGLIDGGALLPNPQISDSPSFSLRIDAIRLGRPLIDAGFTAEGIELFIGLPELTLETRGHIELEGRRLSLDGRITASLAAFARMAVGLEDGTLTADVEEVGVAVEAIQGDFNDAAAEALVSVLGNQFGNLARDLVTELVDDVVQQSLPALVETALGGILQSLEELPLNIDPGIEGIPPVRLVMSMRAQRLELARRLALRLTLDAAIRHPGPVESPHPDPGVPTLEADDEVLVGGEGLGVTVRLALINALLHEIWRGGTLRLQVPVPANLARLAGPTFADAILPPVIVPAPPGAPEPLIAQVGAMRLTMQPEGLSQPHVFQVTLSAGISVALVDGRFQLGVAEEPVVSALLIEKGDGREPILGADGLSTILRTVLWPEIRGALQGGLDFGLDAASVDVGQVADFAPRVQGLTIAPGFAEVPTVRSGRLRLEGGLDLTVDLGP